jgi:hypothetical protein
MRTRAAEVSIQAVSPVSIGDGGGIVDSAGGTEVTDSSAAQAKFKDPNLPKRMRNPPNRILINFKSIFLVIFMSVHYQTWNLVESPSYQFLKANAF